MALIGLGCSISTEAIAKISQHYNVIQVNTCAWCYDVFDIYNIIILDCYQLSCTSTLTMNQDDDTELEYPNYFQLLPSEINLARVFYSIIKEYGWRRVALIVQNEHRYRAVCEFRKNLHYACMFQINADGKQLEVYAVE